jgi:hypothetical protein
MASPVELLKEGSHEWASQAHRHIDDGHGYRRHRIHPMVSATVVRQETQSALLPPRDQNPHWNHS